MMRHLAGHLILSFRLLLYNLAKIRPNDPFHPLPKYISVPWPLILTALEIAQVLGRGHRVGLWPVVLDMWEAACSV